MDEIERMRRTDGADHKWANNVSWNVWFDWKAICRFDRKMSIIYHWWHTQIDPSFSWNVFPLVTTNMMCETMQKRRSIENGQKQKTWTDKSDRLLHMNIEHSAEMTYNKWKYEYYMLLLNCAHQIWLIQNHSANFMWSTHTFLFFCSNACLQWASSAGINGTHQ